MPGDIFEGLPVTQKDNVLSEQINKSNILHLLNQKTSNGLLEVAQIVHQGTFPDILWGPPETYPKEFQYRDAGLLTTEVDLSRDFTEKQRWIDTWRKTLWYSSPQRQIKTPGGKQMFIRLSPPGVVDKHGLSEDVSGYTLGYPSNQVVTVEAQDTILTISSKGTREGRYGQRKNAIYLIRSGEIKPLWWIHVESKIDGAPKFVKILKKVPQASLSIELGQVTELGAPDSRFVANLEMIRDQNKRLSLIMHLDKWFPISQHDGLGVSGMVINLAGPENKSPHISVSAYNEEKKQLSDETLTKFLNNEPGYYLRNVILSTKQVLSAVFKATEIALGAEK